MVAEQRTLGIWHSPNTRLCHPLTRWPGPGWDPFCFSRASPPTNVFCLKTPLWISQWTCDLQHVTNWLQAGSQMCASVQKNEFNKTHPDSSWSFLKDTLFKLKIAVALQVYYIMETGWSSCQSKKNLLWWLAYGMGRGLSEARKLPRVAVKGIGQKESPAGISRSHSLRRGMKGRQGGCNSCSTG